MVNPFFDYEAELNACAAGDQAAFLALYRQEAPAMHALAQAMLGPAGDDVLHEAFVLIWRNAAGYSPKIGTARAWMYSILRYRALHYLSAARIAGDTSIEAAPLPAIVRPATTSGRALGTLPDAQLEALLQAYLRGGDCARIASRTDRTEPDVRASIEAALRHFDEVNSA